MANARTLLQRAAAWCYSNPRTTLLIVLILASVLWYFRVSISDAWATHQVNKANSQLQQQVDSSDKQAQQHQDNADDAGADRQTKEGRAARAQEEKDQAADNSNRTIDPVRKARQRYEETRRSSPVNSPALSDEQLCAELAKRNITCR